MNYLLDLIVVLIILVSAVLAAKKGFVRTLIELVGFLLAVVISVSLSSYIADAVYSDYVKPNVVEAVFETIENKSENALESMPAFVLGIAEKAGLDDDSVHKELSETADDAAARIADTAVKPIAVSLVKCISMIIIMLILIIAVKFAARFINSFFKGIIFGTANKALGAVLGVAKGTVYAIVFCLISSFIVAFFGVDFLFLTEESISGSIFCEFVQNTLSITF